MTERDIQTAADEHYQSRFSEIDRLLGLGRRAAGLGHYGWQDAIEDRLREVPLCVDLVAIYPRREQCEWEILLGTGGPADRVLVTADYSGEIEDADYEFQDWFQPWTRAHGQNADAVRDFAETVGGYYLDKSAVFA